MPETVARFTYRAFISYSHHDKAWGDWLHKAMETYRVPSRLVGTTTAHGTIPRRLNPVFRDREELSSSPELGSKINEALAQSENLVVICSPASAASRWVNEEVLAYKRMGRGGRVFCLIVDGEPNATDLPGRETDECFCPALRFATNSNGEPTHERTEPIAADARPGKDGKPNAKLKLIAGMLGVGFDALKQREQQRRMRRMATIAALGIVGMLVMAVFAGIALRERNQAITQREQAENLIGFMLGNLRTKLEAVNRLDILNDVADHAMAYFEAEHDTGDVESQTQRAQTLLLLGRVRRDQGKVADATDAFDTSVNVSRALYATGHRTPIVAEALIDGEFWLGTVAWQQGQPDTAMEHFQAALPVVHALIAAHPNDDHALQHLAWTDENLGHIYQAKGEFPKAIARYSEALQMSQRLATAKPDNSSYQREVANAEDDVAALLYSRGQLANAEARYTAEVHVLRKLLVRDPQDNGARSALAVAQSFLAQVAEALGHSASARENLRSALQIGDASLSANPDDLDTMGDVASYCRSLSRNLRLSGDTISPEALLDRSEKLYSQMLLTNPGNPRAKYGIAATKLEQAELAWQTRNVSDAQTIATLSYQDFVKLQRIKNYKDYASLGAAKADLLLGTINAANGDLQAAHARWTTALDALRVKGSSNPDELGLRAELLLRLARPNDAQPLIARLDTMQYRDPAYMAWLDLHGESAALAGKAADSRQKEH